jgi:hypothetical protein
MTHRRPPSPRLPIYNDRGRLRSVADRLSATSVKVDAVMQPKQPADAFKECANESVCSSIIGGVATYLEVPSTLVSGALAIVPKANKPEKKTTRLR